MSPYQGISEWRFWSTTHFMEFFQFRETEMMVCNFIWLLLAKYMATFTTSGPKLTTTKIKTCRFSSLWPLRCYTDLQRLVTMTTAPWCCGFMGEGYIRQEVEQHSQWCFEKKKRTEKEKKEGIKHETQYETSFGNSPLSRAMGQEASKNQ